MAVSIEITCDGEGCREAVNREPVSPQRTAFIAFADHEGRRVLVDCRPLVNVTGQELADHLVVAAGPTSLLASEGWTAERTAPTKRYPQGLIFRCPSCAALEPASDSKQEGGA